MTRIVKRITYSLIALLVLAAGIGYWNHRSEGAMNGPSDKKSSKKLHVMGYIISQKTLQDNLQITGSLKPDEEVDLAFETPGKIVNIYFHEGSRVSKGDLLAQVNDAPLQAQLKKLEAQIKLAENRVIRQETMLQKEAVSKEAYEQVQTDLATLRADIELVKANIRQTQLTAPFDGVIGLRQISVGAYASTSTIVAHLTKVTPLKLEVSIPERYSSELKVGSPIEFTLEGENTTFPARVYAINSHVDQDTRTLTARAIFDNPGGRIKPGRYAQIKLEKETITETIAIPSEAIIPEMGKDKVFLYKNGKAQPAEIKTGLRTESMVQVIEGLQLGDTLLTTGVMQLRTDMDVELDQVK